MGALRDDIPASVLSYLMTAISYGMVVAEEVIPAESKVSFEEAIRALGFLLDRGLMPPRAKSRRAARAFVVAMVEKMQAALNGGKAPGPEKDGTS